MSPFKPLRLFLIHAAATLVLIGVAGAAAAGAVVYFGLYDVSAVAQHTRPVYAVLDIALRQTIRQRAKSITPPSLADTALANSGFANFRRHCVTCHGAPGVARADAGKGMLPLPTDLVETARHLTTAEIYWVVRNGIKMTGMPAWRFRLKDTEIWAVVAFVQRLPGLSPEAYRALERAHETACRSEPAPARSSGDRAALHLPVPVGGDSCDDRGRG